MRNVYLLILSALLVWGCAPSEQPEKGTTATTTAMTQDVHSFARPMEAVMKHLTLNLKVDFEKTILEGEAKIQFEKKEDAKEIYLDTDGLSIAKVTDVAGNDLAYELGDPQLYMGKALKVQLPESGNELIVYYTTSPEAGALQWLEASQTAGKKEPFLFTQSQAILARSWVPCQDSPGIRFTYTARVEVPKHLMAVMSANNPTEKNDTGIYTFEMKQPIPAYLLAMSVGDIAFQEVGPRSGVYAEPSLLEKSAYEFADMEKMLDAAEELYGAYQWERYDLIVLPPSFPFGGMENPRLTFATPTILAGDRSLVSLVAHELAHSWSGNLVTNATWNDFWLNEGFTVYFENRIMESIYGESTADMLALISYQDLEETVEGLKSEGKAKDTHLKLDLAGRDPDDGMNAIAYDKGFYLLKLMEETVGREAWDQFLKGYFEKHAFQTMTTEDFLAYLDQTLFRQFPEAEGKIKPKQWIYEAGIPNNCPQVVSDRYGKVAEQAASFVAGSASAKNLNTEGWVYQEWVHFLRNLPEELTQEQLADLDQEFGFTKSGNSEILCQWFLHAIRNQYTPAYDEIEEFCFSVGRRKFIQPIYAEMMKYEATKDMARRIYAKSRPNYHSVAYNTLDEMVK